ncbi:MAG: sigma-70 family RNA polymerase sigma factor [Gammaproteobacteria bacterium]|jgi:RNA polymerase sigma-70 factor (ECF subfamily)|nr:sigma-70 family RNA polymerase sigma factor [Pseudomonadota bacterium]MCZ6731845.1 sigma-70 family RNA polymerase sigma factor [Gammaproteobacteria bacterium]
MHGKKSDEELMLAYGNGDFGAFEIIYERHRGALYRYLLRQCGKAEDAQELSQDVWANLIRARERYEVRAKFTTYLFRLAHNRVVDFYRKSANNPISTSNVVVLDGEGDSDIDELPASDREQPQQRAEFKRLGEQLLAAIDQLPAVQREAFLLREEAGFTIEQIAEVTGVNRETAKSRLRYAVAKLRVSIKDEVGN